MVEVFITLSPLYMDKKFTLLSISHDQDEICIMNLKLLVVQGKNDLHIMVCWQDNDSLTIEIILRYRHEKQE